MMEMMSTLTICHAFFAPGGGGYSPIITVYIGMCRAKGYVFFEPFCSEIGYQFDHFRPK